MDFDLSRTADPGHTINDAGYPIGTKPKHARRRRVARLTASTTTLRSGQQADITVHLDRPAARHGSVLVLLRADSPEIVLPTATRVPAGATTATVKIRTLPNTPTARATISARTLHQLQAPAATTTISMTA